MPRMPYELLALAARGEIILVLSPQVIGDVQTYVAEKKPEHLVKLESFLAMVQYELTPDPPPEEVAAHAALARDASDVPIVLAAAAANADYLITTTLSELKLKEQSLEDWIERRPEILGEPLLIIGRQVQVSGIDNRIDLLAIDREGYLVVIEVKRDTADIPSEFQALRYASAIANWSYETIKNQAESYYRDKNPEVESYFKELIDKFFEGEEVDLNEDQRIILVGRDVHERLIAVANWLLNHTVNIKVVEASLFVDGKSILVSPNIVLPKEGIKAPDDDDTPWRSDGKKWHLQERCSPQTAPLMQTLADKIPAIVTIEGVSWNQKHYVAFRLRGRNWLTVGTHPRQLFVSFHVTPDSFKADEVAKLLGAVVFDHDKTLADKLDIPSSVDIDHQENRDVVFLRIKPDFNFESEGFAEFVRRAHKAGLS